jgi:hypothetical protein
LILLEEIQNRKKEAKERMEREREENRKKEMEAMVEKEL